MAQADGVVANGTGSAVRSDINNQYAALWSNHSGSTEPSSGKVAYQFWADTNTNILKIRNSANNAWINLFTLAGGIDVDAASNFNEDVTFTGASYNLVWDKSDNALEFADNAKAAFGTSSDLTLHHDGSNSYLTNSTGALILQTDNLQIKNAAGNESLIRATADGNAELYFDNNVKLSTNTSGVKIDNGNLLLDRDDAQVVIGGGSDLTLYHNGTDSYIRNSTGVLKLQANDIRFFDYSGSENLAKFVKDGSSELYFDDTKKLHTLTDGIYITGRPQIMSAGNNPACLIEQQTDANYTCLKLRNFYTSSGKNMISFIDDTGNARGSCVIDGVNTTYNTTSDYRLKENEVLISDGIERLKLLKPYRFNWKEDPSKKQDGFFAHEVTPAVPEAVWNEKDKDPGEEGEGYQQLDHSKLVPLLTAAIQELVDRVEKLETA